ncbi:hypothetical protein N431DRAFT_482476 [Stipitochalara longipes BDJ]|nr:hypothetical protein N431DRAFT_482476 [Stipitochalara longipes BDJ]
MNFKQVVRFTGDAAALEKVLRLLQSLAQILAVYTAAAEEAKIWWLLRRQFALGRRYFRFFKFLDAFSKAFDSLYGTVGVVGVLEVGKWSCLGAYLFLESLTILDTMGVWLVPWAETCLVEGNKFWFYSLVCSILLGGVQLYTGDGETKVGNSEKSRGKKQGVKAQQKKLGGIKRRLIADIFDLCIPGFVTGWIVTTHAFVGLAGAVSTILSSKDIWDRLQT